MNLYDARMAMDPCTRCGQRGHHASWHETPAETSARVAAEARPDLILACVEPGCSRITRSRIQFDYLCWEHAPAPEWPAADKPCDPDLDCGRSCEDDGYGGFAYEGQRGGGGDPVEDVYFTCSCEHHEVTR